MQHPEEAAVPKGVPGRLDAKYNDLECIVKGLLWPRLLLAEKMIRRGISVAHSEKQSLISDGKPELDSKIMKQKERW